MQRSKWLAGFLLVGAVAVGGVAGFCAGRYVEARQHTCFEQHRGRVCWDHLAKEWKLTPAQRASVDSLLDQQRQTISALYAPVRPQLDSIAARTRRLSDSTQVKIRGAHARAA